MHQNTGSECRCTVDLALRAVANSHFGVVNRCFVSDLPTQAAAVDGFVHFDVSLWAADWPFGRLIQKILDSPQEWHK
jgi:hypothetical protein